MYDQKESQNGICFVKVKLNDPIDLHDLFQNVIEIYF